MVRFNKEIIEQIEIRIKIPFVDGNYASGEVCFANSSEVRLDFKQSFSTPDILSYIVAILFSQKEIRNFRVKIPYPKDASAFWKLVEQGEELKTDIGNEDIIVEWY